MKVNVKLFATLARRIPNAAGANEDLGPGSGRPFEVDLPDGSTLEDLLAHLDLTGEEFKVVFVNGRSRRLGHALKEGDEVGVFPPIGGG